MSQMAMAAIPERRQVTCQPVKSAALTAAPPVENRMAAAASWRRAIRRARMSREDTPLRPQDRSAGASRRLHLPSDFPAAARRSGGGMRMTVALRAAPPDLPAGAASVYHEWE